MSLFDRLLNSTQPSNKSGVRTKWEKLKDINEKNEGKEPKCMHCEKDVIFTAVDIIYTKGEEKVSWSCTNPDGTRHHETCLGSPDYVPRFKKGDLISAKWKNHETMYTVVRVMKNDHYALDYYGNKWNSKNTVISIKAIDKKARPCDKGTADAIFGK